MSFEAILFDMDGVLVESGEVWFRVLNEVAQAFDAPAITRAQFAQAEGQGLEADQRLFYPKATLAELATAYEQTFPRFTEHMTANPDANTLLPELRAQGVRLALVTNSPQALADNVLRETKFDRHMDAIIGMRPTLRGKPEPDILQAALADLDVVPSAALMVGDTDKDAAAAAAASTAFLHYRMADGASLRAQLADHLRP